ncbi:MAG: PhzF family phenazine biosynthesis protein [Gammaproteobacteria bacterium]|jgi:PhzF family phenazine biosynthesis protein
MLDIAQELNLSETAFVSDTGNSDRVTIRFFSPKMEIPLCGHASLAVAKVLFEENDTTKICLRNIQDLDLIAHRRPDQIGLEFPSYDTVASSVPPALLAALGLETVVNTVYGAETNILVLEIDDPIRLVNLAPDFNALLRSNDSINGVLVTSVSDSVDYDFHSRYFWPWSGSNEDPVTGGTHTFLAKYWSGRLGKTEMRSFQASKRTGSMLVKLVADKVLIRASAVIVLEGALKI